MTECTASILARQEHFRVRRFNYRPIMRAQDPLDRFRADLWRGRLEWRRPSCHSACNISVSRGIGVQNWGLIYFTSTLTAGSFPGATQLDSVGQRSQATYNLVGSISYGENTLNSGHPQTVEI